MKWFVNGDVILVAAAWIVLLAVGGWAVLCGAETLHHVLVTWGVLR
jgi:hypothetical protein